MSWKYLVLPNSLRFPRNHWLYAYHELIMRPVEILPCTWVRTFTENNIRTCITNWSWNRWKYYLVHEFVRAQRIIWLRSPIILIWILTRSSRRHNLLLFFCTRRSNSPSDHLRTRKLPSETVSHEMTYLHPFDPGEHVTSLSRISWVPNSFTLSLSLNYGPSTPLIFLYGDYTRNHTVKSTIPTGSISDKKYFLEFLANCIVLNQQI